MTSVGSPDRWDHTLIGRPVNLADHLTEEATPGAVWISQSTYEKPANKNGFAARTTSVANSEEEPMTVYEMVCL